jgi:tripartite-type tricarboxylate transporter receptor subunit TctC
MGRFVLAACLAPFSAAAAAQQYPSKPIRFIVPFPPGGAAELGARIFTQPLAQVLGQPVVIETKPGADGIVAAEAAKSAPPDGYTLFYATNTAFNWVPITRKNPPYDPVADFTPVSMVGYFGFFLFTHPSLPAKNVAELVAQAKANPGKLNYGTGNSTSQLLGAQLKYLQKIDIVHVPYKGDGPLNVDLLGGRVHMAFATPGAAVPHVKEGRLRCLAAMFANRSPLMADCPTAQEAGLGEMSLQPWGGVFGPAKMPKEVVDKVGGALKTVLARQDVKDGLAKIAFEARSSSPAELTAFLKKQHEVWRDTAQQVGIQPE